MVPARAKLGGVGEVGWLTGGVLPVGHPTWGPRGDWHCGGTGTARSPSIRSWSRKQPGQMSWDICPWGAERDYQARVG